MADINGFGVFADKLDEFADALEEIGDELDEAIDEGTRQTALAVESTARKEAPVEDGDLRADIATNQLEMAAYSVGTTKEYGPPTEYGSAPHPITPDKADALRFINRSGEEIITQHVDHPGTPSQPFIRPALNKHRSDLVQNIQDEIESLINSKL